MEDLHFPKASLWRIALPQLVCSLLLGAAWGLPTQWIGPLASLGFLLLMGLNFRRPWWTRYGLALAYYLAGSMGIVRGTAIFFGTHAALWEGAALWLGSAALLSMGWAFATNPWRMVAVLVIDALPPIGLFDWLSPLSGAGALFPGAGVAGILLLFLMILVADLWRSREDDLGIYLMLLVGLAGISVISNARFLSRHTPAPAGWIGARLHVGPEQKDLMADLARRASWIRETRGQALARPDNRVVLLPETLSTWWVGTGHQVAQAVPTGQTWLVGVSLPLRTVGLMADAIVAVRHDSRADLEGWTGQVVFRSAFPVPVSMWHPWSRGTGYVESQDVGYQAAWWEPVRKIDGVRAWASICYDQLLPWVWMEALIQQPQVILLTNNEWWAKGTDIPVIQRNTAWAWARLLGVPELEAENFS